jgi:site-specific DNA recombinase
MISLARRTEKPFDLILVYKYSRFARSREDSIVYKALLKKSGVQLVSITEPLDDSAMGRLMQAIIECIDEFYSENLGEEVTRGMRESASRGFYLSCRPPYGYRKARVNDGAKQRTKLEIDEFKSRVVAGVFEEVTKGKGLIEITKELNARGVVGPGGKGWAKNGLHQILGNEIYTGTAVWGRSSKRGLPPVKVENACPTIVGKETFQQVQHLLGQRSFAKIHPKRASSRYLLSGLVRCGHCGKALIGLEAKSSKFAYYVCGTLIRKGAGSCPARYLNAEKLENLIIHTIQEHILTPEKITELAALVRQEFNQNADESLAEIKNIDEQLSDISHRLEHLYDAIETGKVSLDDLGPRIRALKEQNEKLLSRKQELNIIMTEKTIEAPAPEEVKECAADLRHSMERGSIAERKSLIRGFIKEINIRGNEAKMTYTLPMLPRGVAEETESVLAIVHYGGRRRTRISNLSCLSCNLFRHVHKHAANVFTTTLKCTCLR